MAGRKEVHPLRWLSGCLLVIGGWGIGTHYWGAILF